MPEKIVNIDHAENIYIGGEKKLPPPAAIPAGLETYMEKLAEKYNCIPTILFKEPLTPFREYYVPNDVKWHEPIPGERNSYRIRTTNGGKISNLLGVSRHLVLSGTGGLGKSMMMRNFVISCVEDGALGLGVFTGDGMPAIKCHGEEHRYALSSRQI